MKISVDLDDTDYTRLHAIKYQVSGSDTCTHAGIMRTALRLLLDAFDASQEGDVLGLSSGKGQRTKKVLVSPRWNGITVERR